MTHEEIRDEMRWIPRGKVKTYSAITPSACAQVGKVQNEELAGEHLVERQPQPRRVELVC